MSVYDDCSIFTGSTGITASNLPGPGRILGNLYGVGGAIVEKKLNKLGKALGISPPVEQPRYLSSDSLESRNAQRANLPGPGRTLDLLYTLSGDALERKLNRAAIKLGFGPDAAMLRIQQRMARTPKGYPRTTFLFMESLRSNGKIAEDCQRLLKYTQSDVLENRRTALKHVTDLAIENPFLRTLLMRLGTLDALRQFDSCESEYCMADIDPLLAYSRKALVCFEEVQIHKIGERTAMVTRWKGEAALQLIDWLINPQVSFVASRYLLKNCESIPIEYIASFCNALSQKTMDFISIDDSEIEWETLDLVIKNMFDLHSYHLFDFTFECDISRYFSAEIINAARTVMSAPDKFPLTIERLLNRVNCATGDYTTLAGISVTRDFIRRSLQTSTTNAHPHTPADKSYGAVEQIQTILGDANGVDECVMEMVRVRSYELLVKDRLCIYFVANPCRLKEIAMRLMDAFSMLGANADSQIQRCLRTIRKLDRYCWKAIHDAVSKEAYRYRSIEKIIWELSSQTALELGAIKHEFFSINVSRVFLPETNRYHYWQKLPKEENPIDDYEVWWPPLPTSAFDGTPIVKSLPRKEEFVVGYANILRLNVPKGTAFNKEGHHALLAGINERYENEYFAILCDVDGSNKLPLCTVTDGAKTAKYVDRSGMMHEADNFQVLVLRFDPYDYGADLLQQAFSLGGSNSTGPLFWL